MPVKTTGAEFKRFYQDDRYWPDALSTYHDDTLFHVNGEPLADGKAIDDAQGTDSISIEYGFVMNSPFHKAGAMPTLESYFRRWKKEQTTVSFVVECDRSSLEAVKSAVLAAGGKLGQ